MKNFKHTQIGYLMIVVAFCLVVFFTWLLNIIPSEENSWLISIIMILVVGLVLSMSTLETLIDEEYLRIKFGYGIFKKKFPLHEIASVRAVKNHIYNGWGIRVWFWPYMWIYNVSGFNAVEIKMRDGRIFRIGTDIPERLEEEISKRIF
ncbi:MAG TPA: hypothetical protein VFQ59_03435 [Candidatus Paceibacterota bacterium]|nr:hypothetical protein [Candidatus Paceibacterota bacterium]